MCELLALTANTPTDICFSFAGLIERGGNTGPHQDGWGITFYEGIGCRSFKDCLPSCDCKIARFVADFPIKSNSVISHIRQGNRGKICLENTHPFTRELWGRNITYAHNGQLSKYSELKNDNFVAVGSTDSELAFCWILNELKKKYPKRPRNMATAWRYVVKLCNHLKTFGVFNMLMTDGAYMLAYCTNNLYYITRKAPFGKAELIDQDMTVNFKDVTTENDIVTIVATKPLTDNESWTQIMPGTHRLFKYGVCVTPQQR
ncbi:MAG: class II glutamine amidotransferase [Psychrosphaera sp.]|nr:class II glutamine amidotransferase [Psychrosphaera sp.]